MIIQFSAQIDSAKANNDRTLSLKLETQELSSEDTAQIFSFFQKQVWVAVAETTITKEDLNIPEKVDPLDSKSPSQRFRDRLAAFYKTRHGKFEGFDDWYKAELNRLGEAYLEKIA
jgi:hypothetical protein